MLAIGVPLYFPMTGGRYSDNHENYVALGNLDVLYPLQDEKDVFFTKPQVVFHRFSCIFAEERY